MKHRVSHQVVADLLHALGYSLQANSKTKEGANHPDRNAQFEHLNGKVKWSLGRHQPVISVHSNRVGLALGPPFLPVILESPHQLLLFRIHRDDRLVPPKLPLHFPVQVLELGVTIRMIRPFFGLLLACRL